MEKEGYSDIGKIKNNDRGRKVVAKYGQVQDGRDLPDVVEKEGGPTKV